MGFVIFSCDQNILNVSPLNEISDADVWNNQALIELYVNSNYNDVGCNFSQNMFCALDDEAYNIHDAGAIGIQEGQLTADNASNVTSINNMFDYWATAYSSIRNINIYFSKINASPVDPVSKTQMNAEMMFIRAFIYSNLIWRYGGVPIITKVFNLNDDYSVKRNSYDECVTYICAELDTVIANLPAKEPADQEGRASGDAAKALKSRVLLYAASPLNNPTNDLAKWQQAADAAAALLNSGYSLNDDYQQTFLEDNPEIIFARYFTQANSVPINEWNGRNGDSGWGGICPTQNIVDDYEMQATGKLPSDPTSGYDPNNPYVGRDPRFYASILYDGAMWMGRETETFDGGLDSPQSNVQAWNATLTGYYLKKFIPENIPPSGGTIMPTNPSIFFRYGEILLNYAEAEFELGDETTARTYVNMIRSRVNMLPITATGDALRQAIHHERRIELAFEGQYFFDVRRWETAMVTENKNLSRMDIIKNVDGSKTYKVQNLLTRKFLIQQYLLPIPYSEITRSLGTLTQNPGY